MKELNKKLAKWVGFKFVEKAHHADIWDFPDGTRWEGQPHFTESLDACFEWLVPKLEWVALAWQDTPKPYSRATIRGKGKSHAGRQYVQEAEKPALALCLAILKLLEKE